MMNRIRELRKALGLNQRDFGERIGVGQSTIANYERGLPPLDTVIRSICREFHVREAWLRDGEGPMMEEKPRDEALAAALEKVLTAGPDDFRRKMISILVQMPSEWWGELEAKARELLEVTPAAPKNVHDLTDAEAHALLQEQLDAEKGETGGRSTSGPGSCATECG